MLNRHNQNLYGSPPPAKYALIPGAASDYFSTPDSVANSISGDLDVRVYVALDKWLPVAGDYQDICGKADAAVNDFSWALRINEVNGVPYFYYTPDGQLTSIVAGVGTAAPVISDGKYLGLRATLDVDNGAAGSDIKFYTRYNSNISSNSDWTQLGSTVTITQTALWPGSSLLTVGTVLFTGNTIAGKVQRVLVYNGINGTLVADFNAARAALNASTFTADTGEVWTKHGSANIQRL